MPVTFTVIELSLSEESVIHPVRQSGYFCNFDFLLTLGVYRGREGGREGGREAGRQAGGQAGRLDSVEWNGGLVSWNGTMEWTGMMKWWAGTSNKLGSCGTIAVIGIVAAFTHRKRFHACVCTSWELNYLQLPNT